MKPRHLVENWHQHLGVPQATVVLDPSRYVATELDPDQLWPAEEVADG